MGKNSGLAEAAAAFGIGYLGGRKEKRQEDKVDRHRKFLEDMARQQNAREATRAQESTELQKLNVRNAEQDFTLGGLRISAAETEKISKELDLFYEQDFIKKNGTDYEGARAAAAVKTEQAMSRLHNISAMNAERILARGVIADNREDVAYQRLEQARKDFGDANFGSPEWFEMMKAKVGAESEAFLRNTRQDAYTEAKGLSDYRKRLATGAGIDVEMLDLGEDIKAFPELAKGATGMSGKYKEAMANKLAETLNTMRQKGVVDVDSMGQIVGGNPEAINLYTRLQGDYARIMTDSLAESNPEFQLAQQSAAGSGTGKLSPDAPIPIKHLYDLPYSKKLQSMMVDWQTSEGATTPEALNKWTPSVIDSRWGPWMKELESVVNTADQKGDLYPEDIDYLRGMQKQISVGRAATGTMQGAEYYMMWRDLATGVAKKLWQKGAAAVKGKAGTSAMDDMAKAGKSMSGKATPKPTEPIFEWEGASPKFPSTPRPTPTGPLGLPAPAQRLGLPAPAGPMPPSGPASPPLWNYPNQSFPPPSGMPMGGPVTPAPTPGAMPGPSMDPWSFLRNQWPYNLPWNSPNPGTTMMPPFGGGMP